MRRVIYAFGLLLLSPSRIMAQPAMSSQIDAVYAAQQRQEQAVRAAQEIQQEQAQREQQVRQQQERVQAAAAAARERELIASQRARNAELQAAKQRDQAYQDQLRSIDLQQKMLVLQAQKAHVTRENEYIDRELAQKSADTDVTKSEADATRNLSMGARTLLEKTGEARVDAASRNIPQINVSAQSD